MTQNEILLQYLREHEEGITAREALLELGIGRLASRICDLKREPFNALISSTPEKVKTRNGSSTTVSRYKLIMIGSCRDCKYARRDENMNEFIFCDWWKGNFDECDVCAIYEKGDNV